MSVEVEITTDSGASSSRIAEMIKSRATEASSPGVARAGSPRPLDQPHLGLLEHRHLLRCLVLRRLRSLDRHHRELENQQQLESYQQGQERLHQGLEHPHQELERHRQGSVRSTRGRTFYFDWGRTGITALHGHQ